jgi:hypothetical protein
MRFCSPGPEMHLGNTWETRRFSVLVAPEALNGIQEVGGSIPPGSTNLLKWLASDGSTRPLGLYPHLYV